MDETNGKTATAETNDPSVSDPEAGSTGAPKTEPTYDVVWPRSALGIQRQRLAPRLDTLDGKRIGFLWDHLFRGDELFPVLAKELTERFDEVEILSYEEFGNTHGGDEAEVIAGLPDKLQARHVDAVVSAMGC